MTQAFQLHIPANKANKAFLNISICLHEYALLLLYNAHHLLLYVTKLKQWTNYTELNDRTIKKHQMWMVRVEENVYHMPEIYQNRKFHINP